MSNVPGSQALVQQGSINFNQPVSEAALAGIAGPVNFLLPLVLPIGSFIDTMLTEAQFQAQLGNPNPSTWVLADGRNVTGSGYQTLTGNTTIPDLRGIARRGKNNGRSDGNQNPDGDLALGTFTTSRFALHTHVLWGSQNASGSETRVSLLGINNGGGGSAPVTNEGSTPAGIQSVGGNDTAPSNVTVNMMIRIN